MALNYEPMIDFTSIFYCAVQEVFFSYLSLLLLRKFWGVNKIIIHSSCAIGALITLWSASGPYMPLFSCLLGIAAGIFGYYTILSEAKKRLEAEEEEYEEEYEEDNQE